MKEGEIQLIYPEDRVVQPSRSKDGVRLSDMQAKMVTVQPVWTVDWSVDEEHLPEALKEYMLAQCDKVGLNTEGCTREFSVDFLCYEGEPSGLRFQVRVVKP